MKTFLKALIGIILLVVGIMLATQSGRRMAGGSGWDGTIPLGTVQIEIKAE